MNFLMVDRCICFSKTFLELKSIAQQHAVTELQSLQQITEFGKRCALCKPYVERMLRSGRTIFPVERRHPFEDPDFQE